MSLANAVDSAVVTRSVENLFACLTVPAAAADARRLLDAIVPPSSPVPVWFATLRARTAPALDAVTNIRTEGLGVARADVAWKLGPQRRLDRWTLVDDGRDWSIVAGEALEPSIDAAAIGLDVELTARAIRTAQSAISGGQSLTLRIHNLDSTPTTLAISTSATLGAVSASPELGLSGLAFAGEATIPPHDTRIVLLDPSATTGAALWLIATSADASASSSGDAAIATNHP